MEGKGMFDYIRNALSITDYSASTEKLLKEYGTNEISKMTLRRVPISFAIDLALQGVSAGKWEQLKKKYGFDKFFHLSLVVDLKNAYEKSALRKGRKIPKQLSVEKLEVVSVNERVDPVEGQEEQAVPIPKGQRITLKGMLDKTRQRMGDTLFFAYSALGNNNCQNFVKNLLESEGLLRQPEKDFIFQDLSELAKELPDTTHFISQGITHLGALANKYLGIGGAKVGEEGIPEGMKLSLHGAGKASKQLNMFEFFKGTGSIGKVANRMGFNVVSLDLESKYTPDIEANILEWDYKKWAEENKFVPDYIWASPPCNTFSVLAYPLKERNTKTSTPFSARAKEGTAILRKTIEIIKYFQKKNPKLLFTIENPRGMMRHDAEIKKLPNRETTLYALYGDFKRKETDFWSNFPMNLTPKTEKYDKSKILLVQDLPTLEQRYSIPSKLVKAILTRAKESYGSEPLTGAFVGSAVAKELPDTNKYLGIGGSMTHRENVLKRYKLEDKGYSLSELSSITGVPEKILQQVFDRGIGAHKTSNKSVRLKGSFVKNVSAPASKKLSKEQWAFARVYSFLDGGDHDEDLRANKGGAKVGLNSLVAGNRNAGFIKMMMAKESDNQEVKDKFAEKVEERNARNAEKRALGDKRVGPELTVESINEKKLQSVEKKNVDSADMSKATHHIMRHNETLTVGEAIEAFYRYLLTNAVQHQPLTSENPTRNYRLTYDIPGEFDKWREESGVEVEDEKEEEEEEEEEEPKPKKKPTVAPIAPIAPPETAEPPRVLKKKPTRAVPAPEPEPAPAPRVLKKKPTVAVAPAAAAAADDEKYEEANIPQEARGLISNKEIEPLYPILRQKAKYSALWDLMRKEYTNSQLDKRGTEANRTRTKLDILSHKINDDQMEEGKSLRRLVNERLDEKFKGLSLPYKEERAERNRLYSLAFSVAEDKKEEFERQLQPTQADLANPEKYLGMKKIPESQLK